MSAANERASSFWMYLSAKTTSGSVGEHLFRHLREEDSRAAEGLHVPFMFGQAFGEAPRVLRRAAPLLERDDARLLDVASGILEK